MKRTLVLRREHLTALSAADLAVVAAGQQPAPPSRECPNDTYYCLSLPPRCESLLCP